MDLQYEYDNGLKVPDFPRYVVTWEKDAAEFRAGHEDAELGLSYGDSERQAVDIFYPGSRNVPVAMFVHGGYWQRMHRHYHSHFAAGLLAHGIAVAIPSYDLCPQVSMAEIVAQLRRAARFVAARSGRALLATGHSAGGHLAAMLLADRSVAAALPISGLFDLPPLLQTTIANPLGMDEAEALRLSPAFMPSPGLPLHAVVGGLEGSEYERQSRTIAENWGGTWEILPGHHHFSILDELVNPESSLVRRAAMMVPR